MRIRKLLHAFYQDITNHTHDVTSSNTEWVEPESIENMLMEIKSLSVNHIPQPFCDWMLDIAERMQCPVDFIAVAAIVTTSAVIGTACGIKPKQQDDWLVVPNLWGGLIARPGMLKTPAVAEVMRLIKPLEAAAKKSYDVEMLRYLADMEVYKADKEVIKAELIKTKKQELKGKSAANSLETAALREELHDTPEPVKPIWKRYKTNDPTVEKLSELLAENPRGLLLYRDELAGLFATWERDGRDGDRAFFIEAWNGDGSMTIDRIGRGTIHVKNLCVSIFGNTQPAKITPYLQQSMSGKDNDGLFQRFQLMIYPDEPKEWKLIDRPANDAARQRVIDNINRIANMNFIECGASRDKEDEIPYFHFDGDAQVAFNEWLIRLEKYRLETKDHPVIVEHLTKYRSLFPSLALIFHLIDVADGKPRNTVSLDNVLKALGWCGYLEKHARRIYGLVNQNINQAVIKLVRKIQEGELASPFTVRDIYRKEWSMLTEKKIVQSACDELEAAGWIRLELPAYTSGRPKLPIYVINPKLRIHSATEENIF